MSQTNGQIPTLLTSIKNTISAIDMDVLPSTWLATKQILKSDKTHLAEHHLYGSSRIGMQKYLPTLLQVAHAGDLAASTYPSLIQEKPWYSLYGNDLFKPTIFSDALSTTNMGTYEMGIQTHVLGNRHYELTNHLGNVQATILDRTTPVMDVTEGTNILTGYSADISTAQDYYPFGMLMPGRYTSDTSRHCVTMNMIMLVPKPGILHAEPTNATPVGFPQGGSPAPPTPWQLPTATAFTEEVLYVYHWLDASSHPNGWVVQANAVDNGISYTLDLSGEPATGVLAFHHLHMDTNMAQQQVGFTLELGQGFQAQMRVRQYYNNSEDLFYDAVSWQNITTGGAQSLTINVDKNAVANAGKTILEVKFLPPRGQQTFPTGTTPIIDRPWLTNTTLVPENRVVTVCDEKDQYRFGFNGMEKDNEAKGLGNSLDFGARIYDSRLGRFLSLDPDAEKYPYQGPYVIADNSPIQLIDVEGKGSDYFVAVKFQSGLPVIKVVDVVYTGEKTPNRLFVQSSTGKKEHNGQHYTRVMIPSTVYGEDDFLSKKELDGRYQYDIDREDYIADGEYNDKGWLARTWESMQDDEDAWSDIRTAASGGILGNLGNKSTGLAKSKGGSSKNEKHGDGGKQMSKAEKQVQEYRKKLETATGSEKKKLQQKIKNVTQAAQKKAKGEEHSKANKR